ncbi:MAG: hypothetical protein ACRDG3_08245 [Tepidiformaceae bacterium]
MGLSLAIAIFGGLVLAFFAATQTGIGEDRWTETVQAHGDLQLFGWVAVFVAVLTFEFIIRVNARGAPLPIAPRLTVLGTLAGGALLRAAGQLWNAQLGFLWPIGAGLIVVGSLVFAWLVWSVKPPRPVRLDPQPLWFWTGAAWLISAAVAGFAGSLQATGGIMPLEDSRLTVELVIRGLVLCSIFAVGVRAFPGHLGLPMLELRRHRALYVLMNASLVVFALGTGAFFLPDAGWLRHIGDFGLAVTLLLATWWMGLPSLMQRFGWQPYYRAMIPIAWLGFVAYAVALGAGAIFPGWGERDILAEGGIRHIFLLGAMAPLMIGMADIVLARFGTGEIAGERWLPVAFALVFVAWPLRVVPPLLTSASGGAAYQSLLGSADVLAAAGLAVAAGVCLRNARQIREIHQRRLRMHAEREREAIQVAQ